MQASSWKQVGTFIVVGSMWLAAACGGVGVGDPGAGGEGGWGVGSDGDGEYTDAGDDAGGPDTSGEETDARQEVGIDGRQTEPPRETDVDDNIDVEQRAAEALRVYRWAETSVGSLGTYVEWHDFAQDGRLEYTEELRETTPHGEHAPTTLESGYDVHSNGAVDWTLPRHATRSDAPAGERRVETFVSARPSYDFVELSPEDDVVEGIERVWVQNGLRAQNEERTRFTGVTATYRDNYDDDETWNTVERVERTVEFSERPYVDMESCSFDLRISVVVRVAQDHEMRRRSHTFEDLACSIPADQGPLFEIVVDRFADTDANLRGAWEQFLEEQGLDRYDRTVFRAFSRGFVPEFHYDVTHRDVMFMGVTNEPLMVGTNVDGPRESEGEGS